ncbi:NAD-dependent epimerase/dehydratase [Desulfatibacillum aliphaticivorans]|uniref:NAD-dependent epimerase/dehydratase n=1 Tax=Desulfatibacillum aliphaticivorans TaxID=218208 RepID=B8F9U2_DESAL|nr:SDR family NAD(P)-dependent oxidoreductase [Desulfatibacillum aliphaticivorans]ACL03038.1 NAD-dependent epimerase/dehydratase [Desulfatibacillum aliphaticivorans]
MASFYTNKKILVSGAAGFIGYHLSKRLLSEGAHVVGLDNLNDYYDVGLKLDRMRQFQESDQFTFVKMDLADRKYMPTLFAENQFDCVVNMAAQAGVRYSLKNSVIAV